MKKIDITKHILVPEHTKLNEKEKQEVFEKYNCSFKELPKIPKIDPAVKHMNLKVGDVVKIIRKSKTAGHAIFYRGVI